MTRFHTGLVVGKFCPLHRGHQWTLDHATNACGQLLILSYTQPEFPGCAPAVRERWLRALYPRAQVLVLDDARLAHHCAQQGLAARTLPHNDAPADLHRHFVDWVLQHLFASGVDAVFTSEDYGDGFAAVLDAAQRARGDRGVVHVAVDQARQAVPISGTALRADVHAGRRWLDRQVYRDFVRRVAILGGESTGKSTLAANLAQALGTAHAAEYGRERWEAQDGVLIYEDLLQIAQTQVTREESLLLQSHRWLICDTSPLTTLLYSQAMFERVDPALHQLAERRYDHVLLCAPDVPFMQDGTRRDDAFRQWQHAWYLQQLQVREIAYTLLQGDWAQRQALALKALSAA